MYLIPNEKFKPIRILVVCDITKTLQISTIFETSGTFILHNNDAKPLYSQVSEKMKIE